MIVRAGTGRALTAPRTRILAAPLPLRKKGVAERRNPLKRHQQLTQVNRSALRKYWWATQLRQDRNWHERGRNQPARRTIARVDIDRVPPLPARSCSSP